MSGPNIDPSPHRILDDALNCGSGGGGDDFLRLRVGAIFIILVCSMTGALFPVLAKRSTRLHVPKGVFDFAKYFGSGVIIATAFIHLLSPAIEELGSPCLAPGWAEYPYALAFCLLSIFSVFVVELAAFRWGTAKLKKIGKTYDPHAHDLDSGHAAHGPEGPPSEPTESKNTADSGGDVESLHALNRGFDDNAMAQIIGVAILEFGVALHSVLIGLTLAVDPQFKVLFVVLIFHQTFEGLGVGSRLAYMRLPPQYHWAPYAGAMIFGFTTPIGIAAGLGIRTTYNPDSPQASIVSGILDSLSAGILIYTGLVELLAHEFLFNKEMMDGSNKKLAFALVAMLAGCAIMALLGKWA